MLFMTYILDHALPDLSFSSRPKVEVYLRLEWRMHESARHCRPLHLQSGRADAVDTACERVIAGRLTLQATSRPGGESFLTVRQGEGTAERGGE